MVNVGSNLAEPKSWNNFDSEFYFYTDEYATTLSGPEVQDTFSSPTFYPGEVWQMNVSITTDTEPSSGAVQVRFEDTDNDEYLGLATIEDYGNNYDASFTVTLTAWEVGGEFSAPLTDETGVQGSIVIEAYGSDSPQIWMNVEAVKLRDGGVTNTGDGPNLDNDTVDSWSTTNE